MRWVGMSCMIFGFIAIGIGLTRLAGFGLGNILRGGFLDMLLFIGLCVLVFYGSMGAAKMTNKIKQRLERQQGRGDE